METLQGPYSQCCSRRELGLCFFITAALLWLLQKKQSHLNSLVHLRLSPASLSSLLLPEMKSWTVRQLLHITDPLTLDVKMYALLVHLYILQLAVCLSSSSACVGVTAF